MLKGRTYVRKLTIEQRAKVLADYAAGKSCREIAAEVGIDHSSVWSFVRRHGTIRSYRQSNRTCSINESAFDEVSEESAYWAGFLMADGSISVRKYSSYVSVAISEKDGFHLESLREFLGSSHKISRVENSGKGYNGGPLSRFTVASIRLVAALATFGVVPNKSRTAEVKRLAYNRHFWRGYVDGDGFLFFAGRKAILGAVGSKPLMEQFAAFIHLGLPDCQATVLPVHSIWTVRTNGCFAKELARDLYQPCRVALPRKLAKAREFMRPINPSA